jgi:hypothetical protein
LGENVGKLPICDALRFAKDDPPVKLKLRLWSREEPNPSTSTDKSFRFFKLFAPGLMGDPGALPVQFNDRMCNLTIEIKMQEFRIQTKYYNNNANYY